MPPSAPFGQSRSAARIIVTGFDAGGRCAAIISTFIDRQLNDVEGVLAHRQHHLRARRSKPIIAVGSPPLGANLMNFGPACQAFAKRSADQPSLPERCGRLVLFGALRARFLGAVPFARSDASPPRW